MLSSHKKAYPRSIKNRIDAHHRYFHFHTLYAFDDCCWDLFYEAQ
jgi:hypothetical protein